MLTDAERDAQWTCAVCGRHHVIPYFARLCEVEHRDEETTR